MDNKESIRSFSEVTGVDRDEAKEVLERFGGDLSRALNAYFINITRTEQQTSASIISKKTPAKKRDSNATTGRASDLSTEENGSLIRAPIPRTQGTLVAQAYREAYTPNVIFARSQAAKSSVFKQNFDPDSDQTSASSSSSSKKKNKPLITAEKSSNNASSSSAIQSAKKKGSASIFAADKTVTKDSATIVPSSSSNPSSTRQIVTRSYADSHTDILVDPSSSSHFSSYSRHAGGIVNNKNRGNISADGYTSTNGGGVQPFGVEKLPKSSSNHQNRNNSRSNQSSRKKYEADQSRIENTPRKDLSLIFRPPIKLLFEGSWEEAIQMAKNQSQWLIVNVQKAEEWTSQLLNRDIWSFPPIQSIIRQNFLFWQVYYDSPDGTRISCYYDLHKFPVIFIVDPRTGERVHDIEVPPAEDFADKAAASITDQLITFVDCFPSFAHRDRIFSEEKKSANETKTKPPPKSTGSAFEQVHFNDDWDLDTVPASPNDHSHSGSTSTAKHHKRKIDEVNALIDEKNNIGIKNSSPNNFTSSKSNVFDAADREAKRMKRIAIVSDGEDEARDEEQLSTSTNSSKFILPESTKGKKKQAKFGIDPDEWKKYVVDSPTQLPSAEFQIVLRLPDNSRQELLLSANAPMRAVFSYIASVGLNPDEYSLIANFPKRVYSFNISSSVTLSNSGIAQREIIYLEKD